MVRSSWHRPPAQGLDDLKTGDIVSFILYHSREIPRLKTIMATIDSDEFGDYLLKTNDGHPLDSLRVRSLRWYESFEEVPKVDIVKCDILSDPLRTPIHRLRAFKGLRLEVEYDQGVPEETREEIRGALAEIALPRNAGVFRFQPAAGQSEGREIDYAQVKEFRYLDHPSKPRNTHEKKNARALFGST